MSSSATHRSIEATWHKVPFVFGVARARALPGPVLIGALADLEVSPSAAKSTLHRMQRSGDLLVERHGRVGRYFLAGETWARFNAVRLGTPMQADVEWEGAFPAIIYDIAEEHRIIRDRVRTIAFDHGFAQLRPGVLIAVRDRCDEVLQATRDISGYVTCAHLSMTLHDAREAASRAWNLPGVLGMHHLALSSLRELDRLDEDELDGPTAMRALDGALNLATSARTCDPDLPTPLLPDGWPRDRVIDSANQARARLGPVAGRHIHLTLQQSGHEDLFEPLA